MRFRKMSYRTLRRLTVVLLLNFNATDCEVKPTAADNENSETTQFKNGEYKINCKKPEDCNSSLGLSCVDQNGSQVLRNSTQLNSNSSWSKCECLHSKISPNNKGYDMVYNQEYGECRSQKTCNTTIEVHKESFWIKCVPGYDCYNGECKKAKIQNKTKDSDIESKEDEILKLIKDHCIAIIQNKTNETKGYDIESKESEILKLIKDHCITIIQNKTNETKVSGIESKEGEILKLIKDHWIAILVISAIIVISAILITFIIILKK